MLGWFKKKFGKKDPTQEAEQPVQEEQQAALTAQAEKSPALDAGQQEAAELIAESMDLPSAEEPAKTPPESTPAQTATTEPARETTKQETGEQKVAAETELELAGAAEPGQIEAEPAQDLREAKVEEEAAETAAVTQHDAVAEKPLQESMPTTAAAWPEEPVAGEAESREFAVEVETETKEHIETSAVAAPTEPVEAHFPEETPSVETTDEPPEQNATPDQTPPPWQPFGEARGASVEQTIPLTEQAREENLEETAEPAQKRPVETSAAVAEEHLDAPIEVTKITRENAVAAPDTADTIAPNLPSTINEEAEPAKKEPAQELDLQPPSEERLATTETAVADTGEVMPAPALAQAVSRTQEKSTAPSMFKRLQERLGKTRDSFIYRLDRLFLGKKEIDHQLFEELEEILITADLGVATTMELLDQARKKVKRDKLSDPQALKGILRDQILAYIESADAPAELVMPKSGPFVIMVVGVNGVGKTTTIGKVAAKFIQSGQSVLLVAGDTFRAAAINQLRIWGDRVGALTIAQNPGSDPSSVVFDGLEYGVAHDYDVVLIDTAGRLHTSVNLMEELKKIKRVIGKKMPGAPHEVLLVLDATTGQNGIVQARLFHDAVGVSGLALTKLDGTAKGGIVANVCREIKIPVRFIGIGEQIDDLRDFDSREFVEALFTQDV